MVSIKFLISLFIEFGSVLSFTYFALQYDFFTGVKALLVAAALSILISIYRDRRLPIFSIVSSIFVYFFGLLSLYFQNPYFVVLEITFFNFLFFFAIIFYKKVLRKNLFKILFGQIFLISERGWDIIEYRWAVVFFLVGAVNELVWHIFGLDVWIYYRLYLFVFLTVFGSTQFFVSRRERLPGSSPWGLRT